MNFLLIFFLFLIGHFIAALAVYLNHRFVLHGNLRRVPFLKPLARLHGLHHANLDENNVDKYIFMPWWSKLSFYALMILFAFINIPFTIGIISFALLYQYRHWSIHHSDDTSKFYYHHHYHHCVDVKKNLSGIYPVLDKVFQTYVETKPTTIIPTSKRWQRISRKSRE